MKITSKEQIKQWIRQNKKGRLKRKEVNLQKEIKNYAESLRDREYEKSCFIGIVGYKYVHVLNKDKKDKKINIQEFFNKYVA